MPSGRPKGGPVAKWSHEEKYAFLQKLIFTGGNNITLPKDFTFRDRTYEGLRQALMTMKRDFLKSDDAPDNAGSDGRNTEMNLEFPSSPAIKETEKKPKTPRKRKAVTDGDDTPTPAKEKKAKTAKVKAAVKEEEVEESEEI